MFPIYSISAPAALTVVAYVGSFSSLFAAVIACTQTDIKRVLAYSTMSQIGYMMVGLGVSGYGGHDGLGYMASMFHLFTHAFFKALLFLGAGAIIHAVHSNDMTDMGGLRKYMPITHATFLIACMTIAGIPPLSGFFSKDEILTAAFHHNKILFFVQYAVAGLTAFYMFRIYFSVFWGKETHYHHTPHEAPLVMTVPLMILALGSALTGFIPFHELVSTDGKPFMTELDFVVAIPSVLIGLVGIGIAAMMYRKESALPDKLAASFSNGYKWAYNKFYMDEVWLFVTKKVIFRYISQPIAWFDRHVVDATMNAIAEVTQVVSFRIRELQSGQLQKYGYIFITGAVMLAILFIYLWK
jgi:NADH-quinone oxidoreductase subunit L